ncbi:MAG TPA: phage holin family protein [Thermoanaerobaculia bacterium]|nr:phage holin family protein [Thermoanaerobaculia bacterium]
MAAPDFYEDRRSLGELFSELTSETRTLIRQEIELAKTELTEKATRAGKDAAMMTAGGILVYAGLLVLLGALVIGLGHLIGYGFAALIVGLAVAGAGAGMVLAGKKDLKNASLAPDRTRRSIKETTQWLKEQRR